MKGRIFMLRKHWRLVLKLAWGKQHYKAWREYPRAGWGLVLWIAFPFIWYYLIFPWLYYWFFDFFWEYHSTTKREMYSWMLPLVTGIIGFFSTFIWLDLKQTAHRDEIYRRRRIRWHLRFERERKKGEEEYQEWLKEFEQKQRESEERHRIFMEERDKMRREHERWMQQQEELARQRKEKNKKQREERRKKREEEERIREENRRKRYQHFCNLRHVAIQRIEKCISERPNGELFGHVYIFTRDESDTIFEDFSIIFGNQVFAVQLTYPEAYLRIGENLLRNQYADKPWKWDLERRMFIDDCIRSRLVPCLFEYDPCTYQPIDVTGWNLRHAVTEENIVPARYIQPSLIEMSSWEVETQMIQFVREYIAFEEEGLKFERGTLTNRTDILWKIDSQGNRSWIQVRKVQKFSPITPAQFEWFLRSEYLLSKYPGYIAQIIYARKGVEKLHPIKSPLRNIAYEMLFEQLQKNITKSENYDI